MKNYLIKIFSVFAILGLVSFISYPKIQSLKIGKKAKLTSVKMKAATCNFFYCAIN